ncbi:hypothetical protein BK816_00825 [Boudabousia tangfeifanii]|uniref:Uncharacterized protein n=1 Tax=Boudabousia tangfeifanii TaxID=1912795 RepID=A0A1D9MI84_9ACTO|nr:hypothetical protein [Boudabousia tangfeifanii]AOZ72017.1 hypothetical protein BK816_00825 [Boudabousia tangfeifanii]
MDQNEKSTSKLVWLYLLLAAVVLAALFGAWRFGYSQGESFGKDSVAAPPIAPAPAPSISETPAPPTTPTAEAPTSEGEDGKQPTPDEGTSADTIQLPRSGKATERNAETHEMPMIGATPFAFEDQLRAMEAVDDAFIKRWGIKPMTPKTAVLPYAKEAGVPSEMDAAARNPYLAKLCEPKLDKLEPDDFLFKLCMGSTNMAMHGDDWWSALLTRQCSEGNEAACKRQTVLGYGLLAHLMASKVKDPNAEPLKNVDQKLVEACREDNYDACLQLLKDTGEFREDFGDISGANDPKEKD